MNEPKLAGEVLKGESSLNPYFQSLIDKYHSPLDPELKETLVEGLRVKGFKIEEPSYGDWVKFRGYLEHIGKCATCNGADTTCSGKKLYLANDHIRIMSVDCPVRTSRKIIKAAQVPAKFRNARFKDFNFTEYRESFISTVADSIRNRQGLFLYGRAGCGKTLLSSIIINERAMDNRRSHFYTVTDLVDDLRDFENPQRRQEKLIKVQTTPCLVIDDLGAEFASQWAASTLFSILDVRYKDGLQTIVNSNFDLESVCGRYPDYHGERISRRLRAMCTPLFMD